jgi:hypothetical protein
MPAGRAPLTLLEGDTVQDAPRSPQAGFRKALTDAAAPAPKPRGPYKKRAIV